MANQAVVMTGGDTQYMGVIVDTESEKMPDPSQLGDVIFLPPIVQQPGQMAEMLNQQADAVDWLSGFAGTDKLMCGCCTSVGLMAEAGLLNNHKATATWWMLRGLAERYPKIDMQENDMLVEDDRFITSAGPYSYIPQVLNLVERFAGAEASRLCAKIAVVEPGRPVNGIYAVPSLFAEHNPLLARAQEIISRELANGISVGALADELGMSERTLHRRLKERVQMSPQQLIASVKMEVAKTMLETTLDPVATIGAAVGFEDDSSFRSAFSKAIGITPSAYRSRMNPRANKVG